MNLNQFDLQKMDGMIMPRTAICEGCGNSYKFFPFVVLTYSFKQKIAENLCDHCVNDLVIEGKMKTKEMKKNIKEKERNARAQAKKRYLDKIEKK